MFDDPNLVSAAGLVAALRLAGAAGLYELCRVVSVRSANAVGKVASVVGGMLAGADSIDDLGLLRHGGLGRLFSGVRAPSTLGTFLRSFTHGHVQQLDSVGGRLLAGLAARVPGLLAGAGAGRLVFVDIDDTVCEVHGHAKQAAAVGYTGKRGLNLQAVTIATAIAAPVIARVRLRSGNTTSATGVGQMLTQGINIARTAGVAGQILARADSAFYGWAFVSAALRAGAWFSVTAKLTSTVTKAIGRIPAKAWTGIDYPNAIYDEHEDRWISDAQVAEIDFVAFTKRRKAEHVPCRLVVRRVKRLAPRAGTGTQEELFTTYRYHAFITNSTLDTITADQHHRGHALIEQVIAELKNGPLAHLPSGNYAANAAWASCAAIAFNIARATAVAAAMPTARWATVRTRIINIPARIATTSRRIILHLPTHWPWTPNWNHLWHTANAPLSRASRNCPVADMKPAR